MKRGQQRQGEGTRGQTAASERKTDEVAEDERRKEASQHSCSCQIVTVDVSLCVGQTDRRMSLLIEILSTVLHRPLIGSLGGGEVGLQ